jgi:hypothetical protein
MQRERRSKIVVASFGPTAFYTHRKRKLPSIIYTQPVDQDPQGFALQAVLQSSHLRLSSTNNVNHAKSTTDDKFQCTRLNHVTSVAEFALTTLFDE